MTPDQSQAWVELLRTNHLVLSMNEQGCSMESIIIAVAAENNRLVEEVILLRRMIPRKITTADGTVFVWHCPDELIPNECCPQYIQGMTGTIYGEDSK